MCFIHLTIQGITFVKTPQTKASSILDIGIGAAMQIEIREALSGAYNVGTCPHIRHITCRVRSSTNCVGCARVGEPIHDTLTLAHMWYHSCITVIGYMSW